MGRTIVIPDIHGEIEKLKALVDKWGVVDEDTLIFLGDYVDRGLHSKEVLNQLVDYKSQYDCRFIRGNHDQWFLDYLLNPFNQEVPHWLHYGGFETVQSYVSDVKDMGEVLIAQEYIRRNYREHLQFLHELEGYVEDDYFYYTHAGVDPFKKNMQSNSSHTFMWMNRDVFFNEKVELDKPVVVGHTTLTTIMGHESEEIYVREDKIALDGGACFGNPLNVMIIDKETGEYEFDYVTRMDS